MSHHLLSALDGQLLPAVDPEAFNVLSGVDEKADNRTVVDVAREALLWP